MTDTDNRSLEEVIDDLLRGRKTITILEAGCGSMSHFRHNGEAHLEGIDISREQLDKNTYLQKKILGDIQDPKALPQNTYDLIICWDVLEHLPHPRRVFLNFMHAVKDGGLILLASPNVLTLRGLITKFTPHWVHVLYGKHIVGVKGAGMPGNYPFKSYHRFAIAPQAIVRFAKGNNLTVELFRYSYWEQPEYKYKTFKFFWDFANKAVNVLTMRKIGTDQQKGFQIILRKKIGGTHGKK